MTNTKIFLAAAVALLTAMPLAFANELPEVGTPEVESKVSLEERVAALQRAYPDLIYSVSRNTMRLMSNRTIVIDDRRRKDFGERLHDADIEDQLWQVYPLGKCHTGRRANFDPGLIRSQEFLRLAYGINEHQVKRYTTMVDWFGTQVRFSTRNGAADALRRVRDQLMQLPENYRGTLKSPERTMEWKTLPDSEQLDVHSFAIAIDLKTEPGDSWRRLHDGMNRPVYGRFNNRIPPAVVAIFENNGFIWGGKWNHFETTHFEYRPELIAIARLAQQRGCEGVAAKKK